MRRLLLALLLVGCASSAGDQVSVQLQQLGATSDFRFSGPVTIQLRITVSNPTAQPVTLSRIELRTIGPGAYILQEPSIPLHLAVPAGMTASVTVAARGSSLGGNVQSVEPVTVRATAYFDAPGGAFVRITNTTFDPAGRE